LEVVLVTAVVLIGVIAAFFASARSAQSAAQVLRNAAEGYVYEKFVDVDLAITD